MNDDDPFRRRRAIEMRTPRDNRFQPHTPLGPGKEFDSIRRMIERSSPAPTYPSRTFTSSANG